MATVTPSIRKGAKRAGRARTVLAIPKEGNRIYGDDVPMPWTEAARECGIPERSFYAIIQSEQIASQMVGKRLMIRPSAVRAYLKRGEKAAR